MAIQLNVGWRRSFVGVVVGVGMLLTSAQNATGLAYELLHGFAVFVREGTIICPDGRLLLAGLIQATDGNFYGTTTLCGAAPGGAGTVFKITAAGAFTTLHSFGGCSDGCEPLAGLIQASDGNFYGTTHTGGAGGGGAGTVFKITAAGALTTLHSFDATAAMAACPWPPSSKLAMATSTARPSSAGRVGRHGLQDHGRGRLHHPAFLRLQHRRLRPRGRPHPG